MICISARHINQALKSKSIRGREEEPPSARARTDAWLHWGSRRSIWIGHSAGSGDRLARNPQCACPLPLWSGRFKDWPSRDDETKPARLKSDGRTDGSNSRLLAPRSRWKSFDKWTGAREHRRKLTKLPPAGPDGPILKINKLSI